ncbi:DUF6492 family protein [Oscillatoria sp. CS-180]|uniref:DUF6492 family protein n=1 Tax=Oscillatoria sp. CS-180 TaxID=3021720 RepID=UPI00232D9A11|nr:DUF6492 family protein [Oscillatoria sp. CS-180]MDB9526891.1 DUF6492 family protein [Oscillatoria sp. CS-180]
MKQAQTDSKIALITLSYAPDFERCKLLVESVERCLTDDVHHYIIVDRRDVALFKPLVSSRSSLRVVEDLLPSWMFRVSGLNKWWMSLRTLPVRNWIMQQLVKMSIFDAIDEDVAVFCDSDNTFIRPVDLSSYLLKGDQVAFLKVDYQSKDIQKWIIASQRLLGLESVQIQPANYISNLIAWRRDNVKAMLDRIEKTNNVSWMRAVCQHRTISEYMIYGIFVDYILGLESANHFLFDTELVKPSWSIPLSTQSEVDDFFGDLKDSHVGVMIHSKDGIPVERYRDQVEALWSQSTQKSLSV